MGSFSGLRRSPGEGNGNPLQCSCLGNSKDRGARWAAVHWVARNRTQLSVYTLLTIKWAWIVGMFWAVSPYLDACWWVNVMQHSTWGLKLLAANQTLSEADFSSLSTGGLLASLVTSENQWIRRYLRFIPTCGLCPSRELVVCNLSEQHCWPSNADKELPFPFLPSSLLPPTTIKSYSQDILLLFAIYFIVPFHDN